MSRRVAVVGAGLAGVCTAFELANLGMWVTVFERGGSVAEHGSFASSAVLAPLLGGSTWRSLGAPRTDAALSWRWQRHRATARLKLSSATAEAMALGQLGLARGAELRRRLQLDDEASVGLLVLLKDAKAVAAAQDHLAGWRERGIAAELVDADRARLLEPGLNPEAGLHSALALIPGGVANGRLFAQQLRTQAQRLGAEFRFHTQVSELQVHGSGIELRHEYTPPEPALAREPQGFGDTQPAPPGPQVERFDAVVVCTGLDVMHLLPTQRLRLAAMHELSVTAPLRVLEAHPELGPKAGVIDPSRGMTIAHVGQRVRVSGSRSVTAAAAKAPAADYESLHRGLQHWFPGSVTHQQVQHWQGRRALAVDGLPVVGASGVPGVWLHLPGDDLGWAGVCGGAQVLAQAVGGHKPLLDVTTLDARRLT